MKIIAASCCLLMTSAAGAQPKAGPAPHNPDMHLFVAAVDRNRDGRMTHAEWTAAGAPESAFHALDRQHRGYVTARDLKEVAAPPGIDLNGDGKVTLEEFKRFNRAHAKAPPPRS